MFLILTWFTILAMVYGAFLFFHGFLDNVLVTILGVLLFVGGCFGATSLGLNASCCPNCAFPLNDCHCSEGLCAECGQAIHGSDKECCDKKFVTEANKCCDICGREIIVKVEVNCEHTASVEIEIATEVTQSVVAICPKCNKSVTSTFCPDCGEKIAEVLPVLGGN